MGVILSGGRRLAAEVEESLFAWLSAGRRLSPGGSKNQERFFDFAPLRSE